MAAESAAAWKDRFEAALNELNFKARSAALARLGLELRNAVPAEAERLQILNGLAPAGSPAFLELGRLLLAQQARGMGFAAQFLEHPSQSVRNAAVGSGLLRPAEAREAFLSAGSSRQLKASLLRCPALPSDDDVLQAAHGVFEPQLVWQVLVRTDDEAQLKRWIAKFDESSSSWSRSEPLTQAFRVARRFPDVLLQLLRDCKVPWMMKWELLSELAVQRPKEVLTFVLAELGNDKSEWHKKKGSQWPSWCPHKVQSTKERLTVWGWHHHPEIMFEICRTDRWGAISLKLTTAYTEITLTKAHVTTNKKVNAVVRVFTERPQEARTPKEVQAYVALLPQLPDHRAKEIEHVIEAFWQMVSQLTEAQRKEALVGNNMALFELFARKLPPPSAVAQFFRLLGEFDVEAKGYKFVQSEICTSDEGKHDVLMQQVFFKYLQKRGEKAESTVVMFQQLLKDAKSMDVVQTSFDALVARLGGKTELGLLHSVVLRMQALDALLKAAQQKGEKPKIPAPVLPLPTGWIRFVHLPRDRKHLIPPHVLYLHLTLSSGGGDGELLGTMLGHFGPRLFWDAMLHVISAVSAAKEGKSAAVGKAPAVDLEALARLDASKLPAPAADDEAALEGARAAALEGSRAALISGAEGLDGQYCRLLNQDPTDASLWTLELVDGKQHIVPASKLSASLDIDAEYARQRAKYLRETESTYVKGIQKAKAQTYGRDAMARASGFSEIIRLAHNDQDPVASFADLLPFLIERLPGEQENVRREAIDALLGNSGQSPLLPVNLWEAHLEKLKVLWAAASKSRGGGWEHAWRAAGQRLLDRVLLHWPEDAAPSEACLFAVEIGQGTLDLADSYKEQSRKSRQEREGRGLSIAAARWVFETAVPLPGTPGAPAGEPLERFWGVLRTMASGVEGAERVLWRDWSFVRQRWEALLLAQVRQTAVGFLLVGVVNHLVRRQAEVAEKLEVDGEISWAPWWEPLEVEAYKAAVAATLSRLSTGDMPPPDAATLLLRRAKAQLAKDALTRELGAGGELPSASSGDGRCRNAGNRKGKGKGKGHGKGKDKGFTPSPWAKGKGKGLAQAGVEADDLPDEVADEHEESYDWCKGKGKGRGAAGAAALTRSRSRALKLLPEDSCVEAEVASLTEVLSATGRGRDRRQVLWRIAELGARCSGPAIGGLLRLALWQLNARTEGMARCVVWEYPYLATMLTRPGRNAGRDAAPSHDQGCDVLTPLLELWLSCSDDQRDARVKELMGRSDAECLLFFGDRFAEHLSNCRQEWLHACLQKLKAPGEGDNVEFYHFENRCPPLARVAVMGKGWRVAPRFNLSMLVPGPVQTYTWHRDTQELFLSKGLASTHMAVLALLTRLEYADGISYAARLLEASPREQVGNEDNGGWTVVQPSGACEDPEAEVARRFAEEEAVAVKNSLDNPEVEQLLLGLGQADDAIRALGVLAQYAGKVKQAKDAVVSAVPNLSPAAARHFIKDVMFGAKAGVALQVAALRMVADIQVPEPLELYRTAWRQGKCHRDVAVSILSKVATSPLIDWKPEDVRDMFFEFFVGEDREEDQSYVASSLATALSGSSKWSLPYLPDVLAKLVLVPGATRPSMSALLAGCSWLPATEALAAVTEVLAHARVAACQGAAGGDDSDVVAALAQYAPSPVEGRQWSSVFQAVVRLRLEQCDPTTLRAFLQVLQRRLEELPADQRAPLNEVLQLWLRSLRADDDDAAWASVLRDVVAWLRPRSRGPADVGTLAGAVSSRALELARSTALSPARWPALLAAVRDLFEVLLREDLALAARPKQPEGAAAAAARTAAAATAKQIVVSHWAPLVARGAEDEELGRLLSQCPTGSELELVSVIAKQAAAQSATDKAPAGLVGRRALVWLAGRSVGAAESDRGNFLSETVELWPGLLARDTEGAGLQQALELLPSSPPYTLHITLVEKLLQAVPAAAKADGVASPPLGPSLAALRWLASLSPRDAVRLWHPLLSWGQAARHGEGPALPEQQEKLLEELLRLCAKHDFAVPPAVARVELAPASLRLLAVSELDSARALAVRAMQDSGAAKNAPAAALLETLTGDAVVVVRTAARQLKAALKQAEEAAAKAK